MINEARNDLLNQTINFLYKLPTNDGYEISENIKSFILELKIAINNFDHIESAIRKGETHE